MSSLSQDSFTGSCRPSKLDYIISGVTEKILGKHIAIDFMFYGLLWVVGMVVLMIVFPFLIVIAFFTRH